MASTTQSLIQGEASYLDGPGQGQASHVGWKQRAKWWVANLVYRCGAIRAIVGIANKWESVASVQRKVVFPFIKRRRQNVLQILIYHRVNDEYDPFFPATPRRAFEAQMEYLASRYFPCSLDEAVLRLQSRDLPDNAVAVTFDDGYRDNFLQAYPILRRARIPATIFLSTGVIGTDQVLWFEKVFTAFRQTQQPFYKSVDERMAPMPIRTLAEKQRTLREVLTYLRGLPDQERQKAVTAVLERLDVAVGTIPGLMLSWDEVREMSDNGVHFGSHTVTHPILSRISPAQLRHELADSKRVIEEQVGKPVISFAYPNGKRADYSPAVKRMLQEAGYRYAVTTEPGNNSGGDELFELKRATPWEDRLPEFALHLAHLKWVS